MATFPPSLTVGTTRLVRDEARLLLSFMLEPADPGPPRRRASREQIEQTLARVGLEVEDNPWRRPAGTARRLNHTQWALWIRDTQGGAIDDSRLDRLRETMTGLIEWVGPVYGGKNTNGVTVRICPLPSVLLIAFRDGLSPRETTRALRRLSDLGLRERPERSQDLSARYFELEDRLHRHVYELRDQIAKGLGRLLQTIAFEQMPFLSPFAHTPGDEYYGQQWNMPIIHAPEAWDITTGDPATIIAVVDSGCEITHPDLLALPGFNMAHPSRDGSPVLNDAGSLEPHGTQVAGIAAAIVDGPAPRSGVAGVAGRCTILPLAIDGATDAQVAAGITRAARTAGVRVINISWHGWWCSVVGGGVVADALVEAHRLGAVVCAAAGNGDARGILSPARHPLVMACGGSDRRDERWSAVTPHEGPVGSHYGDEMIDGVWKGISVVAPAWNEFPDTGMPTTDLTGTEGQVALPSPAGDHWVIGGFSMTSCATPHVSGVAALLFSLHPELGADEVRSIIERTADKTGSVPYGVVDGFPNGTRNEEMGYGRLNAYHAVDFADVMIRDWHGDEGMEPSAAPDGRFWVAPDIVVQSTEGGLFLPDDLDRSLVVAGRPNYVYVRVVNKGPQPARGVRVDARIVVPSLAFRYPADWRTEDDTHIVPGPVRADLGTMAAGAEDLATFVISTEQANLLAEWSDRDQHLCLLDQVTSDNDHAFSGTRDRGDTLIARRNNLAQRNLRVVRSTSEALTYGYSVDAGHEDDESPTLTVRVDAGALARDGRVDLCVGPHEQSIESGPPAGYRATADNPPHCQGRITLLDPARVETDWCGCRAVVSLAPGSEIALGGSAPPSIVKASGADVVGRNCVRLTRPDAEVVIARPPGARVRVTLRCTYPEATVARYAVHLSQRASNGLPTGGVTLILGPAM